MANGKLEGFEDLIAWQKARLLTKAIYRISRSSSFAKDKDLARQIQRAAVSVMSNIAEGYERDNPGDFYRFLEIAKGSCGEVLCQLFVALDNDLMNEDDFTALKQQTREVARIIGGLRQAVGAKRQQMKAQKRLKHP
jgi:four helix bundle protein